LKRLLLVSLVALTGCGIGGRTPSPASPTASSAGATTAMPAFLSVNGPTGGPLLAVVRRDGTTTITSRLGGTKVKITGTDVGYTRHGRLLAVARPESGGARLLSASGRTLWWARTAHGVIQVRRGAKKVRYEFRRQGDDRILVRRGTTDIGAVRATEQGALLVDAQGTTIGISSSPPVEAMAVLMCDEIPPDLRAILTAALLPH
jgi:hypothetical protein